MKHKTLFRLFYNVITCQACLTIKKDLGYLEAICWKAPVAVT